MNKYSDSTVELEEWLSSDPIHIQTVNRMDVFNYHQNYQEDEILVIDFRSSEAFERKNIIGSINLPTEL